MFGIHTEFNSNKRKESIINDVLTREQKSHGVLNVHRINEKNVGDYYCAPHLYFDELKDKKLDISDFRSIFKKKTDNWISQISNNDLILGGGGLLNIKHFKMQMELFEKLASNGKKIVIWGAGHNEINLDDYHKNQKYWIDVNKFGLVGTRDFSFPGEWIPCVSCLNPVFNKTHTEEYEVGLLFNAKSIKDDKLIKKLEKYPQSSNTTNLEEMINFIGKCETLVTNSYHAMYWAILMEKKVVSIPATSKFFDFKYKTPITSFEDFENEIKNATKYTGVLEECREINLKFADKTFDYLNL
ncbi:polysaccharide pyruvyl transferase family protein [Flavobacterium sp.]|jgi:exopolysaccharide biosynthesis predicted pyruvyltransferase EpsI|uniref:polysaccharide pyruvyl transferase family protein n=1 Tax=Flavobacterium sp. TaxID=239 RepID=UPI002A814D71|nr:polysaccharide pyruvyl transferase family protein [Flavobacterium sp.]